MILTHIERKYFTFCNILENKNTVFFVIVLPNTYLKHSVRYCALALFQLIVRTISHTMLLIGLTQEIKMSSAL